MEKNNSLLANYLIICIKADIEKARLVCLIIHLTKSKRLP